MIRYTYVCDRCRQETKTPLRIYGGKIDTKTNQTLTDQQPHNELCPECFEGLVDWIKAGKTITNYEAIIKLYREGKEIKDIELETGIPVAAISHVVAKEGLAAERYPEQIGRPKEDGEEPEFKTYTPSGKRAPGGWLKKLDDETLDKMIADYRDGMTYTAIGKKYGYSKETTSKRIRERMEDKGAQNDD